MAGLVGVKSQNGMNFVRPEKVIAVQASPTGGTVVFLEGGAQVLSIESTTAIAGRIKASEAAHPPAPAYGE